MVYAVELVSGWPEAGRPRNPAQRTLGWHLSLFVRFEELREARRLRPLPDLVEGRPPPSLLLQGEVVHRRYRNQEGDRDRASRSIRAHRRDAGRRIDLSGPPDPLLFAGHHRSRRLDAQSPVARHRIAGRASEYAEASEPAPLSHDARLHQYTQAGQRFVGESPIPAGEIVDQISAVHIVLEHVVIVDRLLEEPARDDEAVDRRGGRVGFYEERLAVDLAQQLAVGLDAR